MLCVERLPTISEYEPPRRCSSSSRRPSITVNLCGSNTELIVLPHCDEPDNATTTHQRTYRDIQCNDRGITDKPTLASDADKLLGKWKEQSKGLDSTKLGSAKLDVEQSNGDDSQKRIASNSNNQSDIRNRTISPSWNTLRTLTRTTHHIKNNNQRDIRHTKINPNSTIIHRMPSSTTQGQNTSDGNNSVIPRGMSNSNNSNSSSIRPTGEPWRSVSMVSSGAQVRVWVRDNKNLVVEATTQENSTNISNSHKDKETKDRQLCKLEEQDNDNTNKKSLTTNQLQPKSVRHLITIPEQISIDSLLATLSPEGQLIIKEIRQQKPSRGNIVVIPIEKNVEL